jgi:hypothetical protein
MLQSPPDIHPYSPGLAQGVSDNRLEIEIQQETRTTTIE